MTDSVRRVIAWPAMRLPRLRDPASRSVSTPEAKGPGRPPSVLLLIALSAVSPLALNIFLPSMPAIGASFGVSYAVAQLILALYLAALAGSQPIIGTVSDRLGRRPVLLAGLVLFLIGSLVCALAPSIGVLLLGRVVQAVGGCAGLVLTRAMVRDLYGREQAASMIGYVTMGMAVVPMAAPAVGGFLEEWYGWRSTFWLLAIVGAAMLAAATLRLGETRRATEAREAPLLKSYAALLGSLPFWAYVLTSSFGSVVFFAFIAGGPYVMTEILHRSPSEYGLWGMTVSGGYILGNYLSGRYAVRIGTRRMNLFGNWVGLTGVALIAALFAAGFVQPFALFGPMFIVGIGNGVMLPSAIAGAVSVRPDLAGAAAGLSGTLQVGMGALVALLVGALLGSTPWPLVAVMLAGSVLAVMSFHLASRG